MDRPSLLLIDLCIRLRLYGLGAWCCRQALARVEHAGYETLAAEVRATPLPAPVFEQILLARLKPPP